MMSEKIKTKKVEQSRYLNYFKKADSFYEPLRTYVRSFGERNSIYYSCRIHPRSYLHGFLRHTRHKAAGGCLKELNYEAAALACIHCVISAIDAFLVFKLGLEVLRKGTAMS
ncbi:MAG: hypothetical protein A2452_01305 [Candidatus Firestonebacteria bacterium RIFOXYC2_FULL_39_67]|nr:MAG: hypothetical protein A2536_06045 [Candidatus Firestonebacteria bacterium RIFOXYD2_FULL_39_29]OGF52791.1 MAG: hypothetical protein A2497_01205 [Candidatus Firestonebacteria bacterium RifOxyC12_full_39_7]OGF54872.1 MAG: hypothetical protein A2452_01305 [Candidatus Firestonebacteria bacterium RIFOXYC2_FULL_39_67]